MPAITIKKRHQLTGHNSGIYDLVAGPEPGTFLSAAGDGWVVQWSVDEPETGRLLAQVDTQVFSMLYLQETHNLVLGDMNGGVHWLNLGEDQTNKHIAHHKKGTYGLFVAEDNVISLGGSGIITRWDIQQQQTIESLQLSARALRCGQYLASSKEIIVGSSDGNIYLLDAKDMTINHQQHNAHDNSVFCLQQHPKDPGILMSGGRDAHLKVWNLFDLQKPLSSQAAHWFTINDLIYSPDGKYLLTASRDKTIRIWDAKRYQLLKTLDAIRDGGHVNSVNSLLWVPGTSCFVSASDDRTLILWEFADEV
jgi:WD40 repeat protein